MASLIDRYLALPGELQNLILSYCTNNDLVCLSLTNKTLHSLVAIPKPAPLHTNELLCPPDPLEILHRWAWGEGERPNGFYKNLCRVNECLHDGIFDCELWLRLREWMPQGTRYCRECHRFTKRDKRRRKGACNCTRPARRTANNNWTYRKNRGFHSDFWKIYYTEANLAKVIRRFTKPRETKSPYGLRERTKPTQKLLEHTSNYQYTQDYRGGWYRSDFT
ncbi:hypothetical protein VE03_04112 [Pseudogymnoascus sp. 23342-1-I1]|nr:hypothetical protein VE03_04112 [Pseudogymnoascus sp. 23342-1-I1]